MPVPKVSSPLLGNGSPSSSVSDSLDYQENSDANRLLDIVRARASDLQGAKLGRRFTVDNFDFELIFAKRNTVYRVRGAVTWYAKIPSRDGGEKALREKLGAEVMTRVSQTGAPCFASPEVAVCPDHGIIVSAAVPGAPMHSQLYRSIFAMHFRNDHWILEAYRNLGATLAAFHACVDMDTEPTTHATANEEFNSVANLLPEHSYDPRLREFISEKAIGKTELALIHGNLRRENVLLTPDRRIGMIDFEDVGLGSRYDDLSQISGSMLLTKTANWFPWRPVYRALNALLCGYSQHTPICEKTLLRFLSIRVATKLALTFSKKPQTIARIPISPRKTSQLLSNLIAAFDRSSLADVDRRLDIQPKSEN